MISIPYGNTHLTMCEDGVVQVLESRIGELKGAKSQEELVAQAMEHPLRTPPLWELARGKASATIIISDHTRPVPSKKIIPFMLKQLRQGNPDIKITLLVATGCHRGTRQEELSQYHQLCWWFAITPPGSFVFPPKGGLTNRSFLLLVTA